MAKALLGHRVYRDDRLVLENARLRSRVRDLEILVERLQRESDRLQANQPTAGAVRQPVH